MPRIFAAWLLNRRRAVLWSVLTFSAVCLVGIGLRLRPDFAVEYFFPEHDRSKIDYDRYNADFPYDDCRALILVQADDLFTRAGLRRLDALERDLSALAGVVDTDGPLTVRDVTAGADADGEATIRVQELFSGTALSDPELARGRDTATTDPLFRWGLTPPDGSAVVLRVALDPAIGDHAEARMTFLLAARAVLARHETAGQALTLIGLPVLRAEYAELIGRDMATLMPVSFAVTLILLFVIFRSTTFVGASVLTILASAIWTMGASAALGIPVQLLTQLTPIVCMIVSISDTVHIANHYRAALATTGSADEAVRDSLIDNFGPCLLTEVVIAIGFLGLLAQDMRMISEFGLLTAIGMLLTWAANVTVLPLALLSLGARAKTATPAETAATRVLGGTTRRIARLGELRPGLVVMVAVLVTAGALIAARGIGREYFTYDDLPAGSRLSRNLRRLETVQGGSVSLTVFLEPKDRDVLVLTGAPADAAAVRDQVAGGPIGARIEAIAAVPQLLARLDRVDVGATPGILLIAADGAQHASPADVDRVIAKATALGWAVAALRGADATDLDAEAWARRGVSRCVDAGDPGASAHLRALLRSGEPMLDPVAIQLMDRVRGYLESTFPEIRRAASAADYWRKLHRIWGGEPAAGMTDLPDSRAAAAQELELLTPDDVGDFLSYDRATAAVLCVVPDVGSTRSTEMMTMLQAWLQQQSAATGYRLTATGLLSITDGIYRNLVGGLALSLGVAVLISLVAFTAVLRSWRLGLIALVPNLLPLLLTFGIMAALGIDLKPTTVICFSITLVIADDDTIQYLVRFRRRYLELQADGVHGHHGRVARETLEHTGTSMLVSALSISSGFLTLMLSEFVGLRNLGLLIGVSLFSAVFADLYLSPILLRTFRPRIGRPGP